MDFEMAVFKYLAHKGLFVSPQFSIPSEEGGEWSCPDFVALDIPNKTVIVVEVTAAANINSLATKVKNRKTQWFDRIEVLLTNRQIISDGWKFESWLFIREDCVNSMETKIGSCVDVKISPLERIVFPWKWDWSQR